MKFVEMSYVEKVNQVAASLANDKDFRKYMERQSNPLQTLIDGVCDYLEIKGV